MDEVSRCGTPVNEIASSPACALDRVPKAVEQPSESRIDRLGEQNSDVQVAVTRRSAAREAAEQVRGQDARVRLQCFAGAGDYKFRLRGIHGYERRRWVNLAKVTHPGGTE